MISRDVKDGVWPSTKRRRAAARSKTVWQGVALAAGLNLVLFSLALLAPAGMWLALMGLVFGSVCTTLVVKNILDEA